MQGGHRNIIKYIDTKMMYYYKSEEGWVKSTMFCIATGLYQADIVVFIYLDIGTGEVGLMKVFWMKKRHWDSCILVKVVLFH